MNDTPAPYEPPPGAVLTTTGEVKRLGWRWSYLSGSGIWPPEVLGSGSHPCLAWPPEPVMVSIDVEHLRNVRRGFTSHPAQLHDDAAPTGRKAALLAIDAAIAEAEGRS